MQRTVLAAVLLLAVPAPAASQAKRSTEAESTKAAAGGKILRYVRERFNIPDSVTLTVGPFQPSPYPDFYETSITLESGKDKRSQKFYISRDGRYLIEGNIFTLGADPRREIVRSISLEDEPTQGPANAPVTIVEYSDMQCPTCARMHEFLEKELLPKYGDKVQIVFKEFPLTNIHDWALTAALAAQCIYQADPKDFAPFRSQVFTNQTKITAAEARDTLLNYAQQLGLDRVKMGVCVDNKESLPRIEKDAEEGQTLGIASVPTLFVNGRIVVGAPEPAEFYKIVDEALAAVK